MPKITIDLTQEEYDRIPGKKQPWLTKLARQALGLVQPELKSPDQTFVFRTEEGIKTASGVSPAIAAKSLGLEFLDADWCTEAEALQNGWLEKDPMDV